jgi:hypothetical protein
MKPINSGYVLEENIYYIELQDSIDASHETTRYELTKPKPTNNMKTSTYTNLKNLKDTSKQELEQITTIGYGTLHQDYPLELMEFKRRKPTVEDVVIDILYCGVCHSDRTINHYINVF